MRRVDSRSSRCNSPGEALHVGASSVALRPPVPSISEITDTRTHTQTHTQNTAINIIDTVSYRFGEVCFHVAAILFKVEASLILTVTNRTNSCTELACIWNQALSKVNSINIFLANLIHIIYFLLVPGSIFQGTCSWYLLLSNVINGPWRKNK